MLRVTGSTLGEVREPLKLHEKMQEMVNAQASSILRTQRLQCSSVLVMAHFWHGEYNILLKQELHLSLWVEIWEFLNTEGVLC